MSINGWMDEADAVSAYNGILLSQEKGGSTDPCYNVDEP